MFWIVVIVIGVFLFRFFSDLQKDKDQIAEGLDNKFRYIIQVINIAAFNGDGKVNFVSKREFNLYKQGSNQIIAFYYSTGILTVCWRYKYFQKEVVYKKNIYEARNLSIFQQQNIAGKIIDEMVEVIKKHQISVLGDVDFSDLASRLDLANKAKESKSN